MLVQLGTSKIVNSKCDNRASMVVKTLSLTFHIYWVEIINNVITNYFNISQLDP